VTGPDSIGLSATAIVPIDIETYSLGGAEWMDVVLQLPTNGDARVATIRQRLRWSSGDNSSDRRDTSAPRIFAEWAIFSS
jgi:hypothetical protein